jgi:hypothetical protein
MAETPKQGGAIFEPRSLLDNKKKFGRSGSRLFPEIQSPQQGAAELQHAITNKVREYLLDEATNLQKFCHDTSLPVGLTYDRFQRMNRGETMMTLTDLMFWATQIPDFARFLGGTVHRLNMPSPDAKSPSVTPQTSTK